MLQQRPTSAEIPVLQGALFKKKTGLLGSSFQKRWFRIEGDKLMYYKEREDLEHLGVIELSNCKVNRNPGPEETDPFVFVLELPNRRFVLKASKKEHFTIWVETLEKWTNKFRQEREVSSFVPSSSFGRMSSSASLSQQVQHFQEQRNASVPNLPSSSLLHSQDVKDLKESRDGGEDDEDVQFPAPEGGVPPEVHAQSLLKVQQVLEKVKQQEVLLNTAMQKVEKFKQKAFVLQELLEFKRDAVGDPARRINSLMKGYTSLERSIEDVTRSLSHHADGPSRSGTQEAEVRMRLVVQRAEAQLANEKRMRRELEERLFRSEVMSMKLNELLSGRDVNWIDANVLWANCLRDQVPSSEYAGWIQTKIVSRKSE